MIIETTNTETFQNKHKILNYVVSDLILDQNVEQIRDTLIGSRRKVVDRRQNYRRMLSASKKVCPF